MLDTSIQIKTDRFDGPLSLLLLLVKKEEVDIQSLNLPSITEQYLNYLSSMKELDFNIAGDYLYLAATLVLLKSKTAISWEENRFIKEEFEAEGNLEIQDHADLVRRLQELASFQELGKKLWALPRLNEDTFTRPKINKKNVTDPSLLSADLEKLVMAMIGIIDREKRKYSIIKRDRQTIADKLSFLKKILQKGMETDLLSLLREDKTTPIETKDDIILTFVSLLELTRLKKVKIFQETYCGAITVHVAESLEDVDIDHLSVITPPKQEGPIPMGLLQ